MTYYMIIFLLSPILNRGCESLSKNGFLLIISLLVLYQTISFIRIEPSGGCNFLGLLTIFLLGRYFRIHKIEIERKKVYGVLLYVAVVVVCLLTGHAVIRLSECILSKINTHKFEDCSIFVK